MEITLKLDIKQVNLIRQGLAEFPYKVVAGILDAINKQVEEQVAPAPEPPNA